MIKKHFRKTILPTISTLALIMCNSSETFATSHVMSGNADLSSGLNLSNGPFVSNDWVQLNDPDNTNMTLTTDVPGINVHYIDMNNVGDSFTPANLNINVTANATLGSIANAGGGNQAQTLAVSNGVSLILSGTSNNTDFYDSYNIIALTIGNSSALTINNFNGGAPTFWVNNIDSTTNGDASTLNIYGSYYLANTAIGSIRPLNIININADGITFAAVNATTINVNTGAPNFQNAVNATTVNIGNGSASFGQNADSAITTINLQHQNSAVNIEGYTLTSNIVNTYGSIGSTIVNASDNQGSTLAGSIGTSASPISAVNFVADQTLDFDATNGTLNIHAPITTTNINTGTFSPYDGTVNTFYDIGTSSYPIKDVLLNYNSEWSVRDAILIINSDDGKLRSIYAPITTSDNNHNTLQTNNASVLFTQNIGTSGAYLATTTFAGSGTQTITMAGPTEIYSNNVTIQNLTFNSSAQNTTINGTNFTANNAIINTGSESLTVNATNITLTDAVTIRGNFVSGQTAMALSHNASISGLTALTFDVVKNTSTPTSGSSTMTILSGLIDSNLPGGVTPHVASFDGYWHYDANGVLNYNTSSYAGTGIARDLGSNASVTVLSGSPTGYVDGQDGLLVTNSAGTVITLGETTSAVNIYGIDLGTNSGATSSISVVTNNVSLGSIDTRGPAPAPVSVQGVTLTLTGLAPATAHRNIGVNDYSGLGTVTLSNAGASEVDIAATITNTTFTNNFTVANSTTGIFHILEGATGNIFTGSLGDATHLFQTIQLAQNTNVTFKGPNIATNSWAGNRGIRIGSNSTMTFDSTNNAITITGAIDGLSAGDQGTLALVANGHDITVQNDVGTDNYALHAINMLFDSANNAIFNGTVSATNVLMRGFGGNAIFKNNAGATNFTIAGGTTMQVDSTTQAVTITGPIDGYSDGTGDLVLTAASAGNSHNITINGAIGGIHPLDSLTISVPSTGTAGMMGTQYATLNFNNDVTVNGNIDMSNSGAIVQLNGITFTSLNGNFLTAIGTNTGSAQYSGTQLSNATINLPNGSMILNGDIGMYSANIITAAHGIALNGFDFNSEYEIIINADITTNGNGNTGGSINLSGGVGMTLVGSAGSVGNTINIALSGGTAMMIDATAASRNIHAPITGGSAINVTGGNVTFYEDIGSSCPLNIETNHSVTFDSASVTGFASRNISTPIVNNSGTINQGTLKTSGERTILFEGTVGIGGNGALASIDTTGSAGTNQFGAIAFQQNVAANILTVGVSPVAFAMSAPSNIVMTNANSSIMLGGTSYAVNLTNATGVAGAGTLIVNNNVNTSLSGTFGGPGTAALKSIGCYSDGMDAFTLTIDASGGAQNIYASIINQDNTGTFAISGGNVTIFGDMGTNDIPIKGINIASDNILTIDATSAARTIYGPITTYQTGKGTFSTNGGNVTFTQSVGASNLSLKNLNLVGSGSSAITMMNGVTDIWAQNVLHQASILDANNSNLNIHSSSYIMNNAVLNAGTQTIAVTGGTATLEGIITINATFAETGQVVLDLSNAGTINDTGITTLTFNITNSMGVTPVSGNTITMIKGIGANVVSTLGVGTDSKWVASGGTLTYTLPATYVPPSQSTETLDDIKSKIESTPNTQLGQGETQLVFALAHEQGSLAQNLQASNMAPDLASTLAEVFVTEGPEATSNLLNIVDNAAQTTANAGSVSVSSALSARLASTVTVPSGSGIGSFPAITSNTTTTATPNAGSVGSTRSTTTTTQMELGAEEESITPGADLEAAAYGIAAGSSPYDKFGVWGSVNIGQASQKINKGNPAFNSFSKGASIGVDTMINERTVIGFNISNSFSNIKYKGNPQGNKTDVSSWIGAIYGNYQFHDKWFVRGTALFNKTHINNKSLRKIVGGYGIAQAKYNMISYGGDANIGFTHRFANQVILTPTIGVRLLHNNKIAYTETGNTGQNISSSQKALNAYSSLAGISVARSFLRSNMELTPEAHINAQYGINSKGPKGSFVSPLNPNINTSFVGTSPSKLTTVYGVSFTGSTDRIECSLGGDMTMSDKYVGYQGSVKLKVKF